MDSCLARYIRRKYTNPMTQAMLLGELEPRPEDVARLRREVPLGTIMSAKRALDLAVNYRVPYNALFSHKYDAVQ